MNFKKLLKIIGFVLGPLVPLMVVIYFLFPYINENKYKDVAESYEKNKVIAEGKNREMPHRDYETLKEQTKVFQENIKKLRGVIDSVNVLNDSLRDELLAEKNRIEELQQSETVSDTASDGQEKAQIAKMEMETENFAESAQSLLSLDDEKLAPILNEMSDAQLIRLFREGNSLQQKKLLRTLESKRAAKLMTEVL